MFNYLKDLISDIKTGIEAGKIAYALKVEGDEVQSQLEKATAGNSPKANASKRKAHEQALKAVSLFTRKVKSFESTVNGYSKVALSVSTTVVFVVSAYNTVKKYCAAKLSTVKSYFTK